MQNETQSEKTITVTTELYGLSKAPILRITENHGKCKSKIVPMEECIAFAMNIIERYKTDGYTVEFNV